MHERNNLSHGFNRVEEAQSNQASYHYSGRVLSVLTNRTLKANIHMTYMYKMGNEEVLCVK